MAVSVKALSAIFKILGVVLDKCLAPFLAYKAGKNKVEKEELEEDIATLENVNEILQRQSTGTITDIDSADELFATYEKA